MSTTDQNGSSRTPDEIRAEIERTRAGLSYDVDALADKVNPSSIAHRQTEKVKSRFSGVKARRTTRPRPPRVPVTTPRAASRTPRRRPCRRPRATRSRSA
jgi:hypothetical protein